MRGLRVVIVGVALQALACATRYHPTIPMRTRSGDVSMELKVVSAGGGRELTFESRSTVPHSISYAWLTVPTRVPCSGGAEVDRITVDGDPTSAGSLSPGTHEIRARFDPADNDFLLDTVLDLQIENGGCIRAPAVSQVIPLVPLKRPLLLVSMNLDGTQNLSGLRAVVGLQAGGAVWLGPLLVAAQAGIASTTCHADDCGKNSEGMLRTGLAFPMTLDTRYKVGSVVRGRLFNVVSVGARYSFIPVSLPALEGERRLSVHGFHGVFSWAFADAVRGPFEHRERSSTFEMSIPIGVLVDPDAPSHKVAFAAAMCLRYLWPL